MQVQGDQPLSSGQPKSTGAMDYNSLSDDQLARMVQIKEKYGKAPHEMSDDELAHALQQESGGSQASEKQSDRPWHDVSLKGVGRAALNALPTAGAIGGGLLGAPLGPIGAVGMAGAGGVAGQSLKDSLEKAFDTGEGPKSYEEQGKGLLNAGLSGVTQEMGGQVLSAPKYGLIDRAGSALSKAGEKVKDFANTKAFKSSGAMLKDFRSANAKGDLEDMGQFMLDKGLVKAGDKLEDVASKAAKFNEGAGARLDHAYEDASKAMAEGANMETATAETLKKLSTSGFNPVRDKNEILKAAKEKLGDAVGGKAAIKKLDEYLTEIGSKYGDAVLDPRASNDIKGALDDVINYSRNPLSKEPDVEKAFSSARKLLNKKIIDHVDALGEVAGNPDAAKALKEANRDYGYSATVKKLANDRALREQSNQMFGLTDKITGTGGVLGGGLLGSAHGHTLEGAALGAGLGVANKLGRTYGNPIMAAGANAVAPSIDTLGKSAAQGLMSAPTKEAADLAIRSALENSRKKGRSSPSPINQRNEPNNFMSEDR